MKPPRGPLSARKVWGALGNFFFRSFFSIGTPPRWDAKIREQAEQIRQKDEVIVGLSKKLEAARAALNDTKAELGRALTYEDLHYGVLSRHVKTFTYFPTAYINDVFLDMLNFKPDGPDDLGVCTRLIRYQAASSAKRLGLPPPQFPGLRRPRKLDYKTEYLVYSIYVHGGWTEEQLAALFGISAPLVSDLVHTWAVFIGDYFAKCMPIPTRSQMLRAYPARILATFGHCRIFLHLDATEVRAEVPTNKEGHSAMHSTYKACSTIKFLAGVDPIGTAWPDSVSEGFPGAVSDPAQTKATGIIRKNIPGGHCVCVDKGFLVENECAMCGVTCIRPTKKKAGQKQQSDKETILTQKVGNTRIVVEQSNGQMKMANRYFDGKVPITQTSVVSALFRNGFMFQNFKVGFVIGNHQGSTGGRQCKAAIRWLGKTDSGLIDARGLPETWATRSERARLAQLMIASAGELSLSSSAGLSPVDAAELLFSGAHVMYGPTGQERRHMRGYISHFRS